MFGVLEVSMEEVLPFSWGASLRKLSDWPVWGKGGRSLERAVISGAWRREDGVGVDVVEWRAG